MKHLNNFKFFESEYSDEFDYDYDLIMDIFQEVIDEYSIDLNTTWQEYDIEDHGIYYDIFRADCVFIHIEYVGDEFREKFSLLISDVYDEMIPRLESIGYTIEDLVSPENFEVIEIEIYYPK